MIPSDDGDSDKDMKQNTDDTTRQPSFRQRQRQLLPKQVATLCLGLTLAAGSVLGLGLSPVSAAVAGDMQKYDGFAEYAQENKMEKSDVACFAQQCGAQTKALFSNPRGIKGVSCLGRCKGEQSCATRCFAEFGSESLNNWLSCTIEENGCVKVPKNEAIDNSAENVGFAGTLQNFDPSTLLGTWYKTDGLNQTTICLIVNPIHFRVVVVLVIVLLVAVAVAIRRTRNWTWVFSFVCDDPRNPVVAIGITT
jgi:hypothetical protein